MHLKIETINFKVLTIDDSHSKIYIQNPFKIKQIWQIADNNKQITLNNLQIALKLKPAVTAKNSYFGQCDCSHR